MVGNTDAHRALCEERARALSGYKKAPYTPSASVLHSSEKKKWNKAPVNYGCDNLPHRHRIAGPVGCWFGLPDDSIELSNTGSAPLWLGCRA